MLSKQPARRRWYWGLTAIAFFCAFLVSCLQQPSTPLRVGTNLWPGYESLYLARELEYYQDPNIQLIDYPSSTEVSRAFRNNNLEVAALTLDESFLLAQTIPDVRIILITDTSNGADVIISKPEIKSLNDLKTKRIGVETTALGAYMLTRGLDQVKMPVTDVQIISLGVSEHEQAYKENKVDAVVTFEPVRSNLLKIGGNILFNSSQIPGEIVDVLVVRQDALNNSKKSLDNLIKGWFKALDYLAEKPDDATKRMALREGISQSQFQESLQLLHIPSREENQKLLSKTDPSLSPAAQKLVKVMLEKQLIQQAINPDSLFEPSLVNSQ